jgi:hypothetical protein
MITIDKETTGLTYSPNANSSVGKPDAERAAIAAEGPGMGITGIFSLAHSLACGRYNMLNISRHGAL